ncbi:MAG: ABC transporter permease [Bacteroidota bacterium]
MSGQSVASLFWKRFRSGFQGMAGLILVAIALIVSVFCYCIMPDDTPDANEMHVSLALLPPGSEVTFLLLPNHASNQASALPGWIGGFPSKFKSVPVDTFYVKGQSILWSEFDGDPGVSSEMQSVNIADFCIRSGNQVSNDNFDVADCLLQHTETRTYWLGTDKFGRDQFSRLLAGTRVSMSVGLIAVIISLLIGVLLGALAGFFRGKVDSFIMWFTTVVWSVPTLLLVIAITLALGKGFVQVFIAVGLTMWVEVARLMRGQIFSIREKDFVEAGRALGFGDFRIILRHVLPNVMGPVVVVAASNFASAILLEAGLSFLGMGAQPPMPSWGMMIKESYSYIVLGAAHLAIFPGLAIMIMVLAFTWLGNGLRDALDTRSNDNR